MDKAIIESVEGLKEIASKLYQDGDLSMTDYGKIRADLERAKQMMLAADQAYDAKHERMMNPA